MQEVVAMQGTPQGVTGADARDGDVTPSRVSVDGFWSVGKLLPAAYGTLARGTRVKAWFDGTDAVEIKMGEVFGLSTSVETTRAGLASMINDLGAMKARIDIALDAANGVPGTYVPREVHEDDVPW